MLTSVFIFVNVIVISNVVDYVVVVVVDELIHEFHFIFPQKSRDFRTLHRKEKNDPSKSYQFISKCQYYFIDKNVQNEHGYFMVLFGTHLVILALFGFQ